MDTSEALTEIRNADTPELALYWLRLATADRSYCHDIATPTDARLATERALTLDEPAGFVAILATGAERLHALLARVAIRCNSRYETPRRWPDRITARELHRAVAEPASMPRQTLIARMKAHPGYEVRTVGKRRFHTIPYSALEAIRERKPVPRPEWLWTKQTRAAIAKAHARRRRLEKARLARKIRRLARLERLRRERILEALRNPRPLETFSDALDAIESNEIRSLASEKSERINVTQVSRLLRVSRSTARSRMKQHPDVKRMGIQLTIPRADVWKLDCAPGPKKPKRDERPPAGVPADRMVLSDLCALTGHAYVTLKKRLVLHPEYEKIGKFHTIPRKAMRQFLVLRKLPKQPKAF